VHLLQRQDSLQMLVNRRTNAEDVRVLVPTRVVPSLPAELKTHYLFEPASSRIICERAKYHLDVYDVQKRLHLTVGPFVSPRALADNQPIKTLHYMRLDMCLNKADYLFEIKGCQEDKVPIYIYACSLQNATRSASLIGHWRVDHISPRVILRDTDDTILIVPAATSREAADACVRHEWNCQVKGRE
jgi:hypothetical protein